MKWGGGMLGAVFLLTVGMIVGDSDSDSSTTAADNSSSSSQGSASSDNKKKAQKVDKDAVHATGETVTTDKGLAVTVGILKPVADPLGDTSLCTNVSYDNGTNGSVSVDYFSWELLNPSGQVLSTTIPLGDAKPLQHSELIPGGTASGDVCFRYSGEPGEYTVMYEQSLFSSDKIKWKQNL